jgi:DinB superfamily
MTQLSHRRPERSEAAEYYFGYIDQIPDSNVLDALTRQRDAALAVLRGVPETTAGHRYAPDKWTLREVVGHINDTERLFCARAFWFARGFDSPLPSFDQNVAIAAARFERRSWRDLVDEFAIVRDATLAFFRALPDDAWDRRGVASDKPFTRARAGVSRGGARASSPGYRQDTVSAV